MDSSIQATAAANRKVRISLPTHAEAGSRVSVKTLISHPMHNGFRHDSQGRPIARDILTEFRCLYNQRLVFQAQLMPGIAANPFLAFAFTADVSGSLQFIWTDQHGHTTEASRQLNVTELGA